MANANSTSLKSCCRCHEHKPRSEFYGDNRATDGLQGACKPCFLYGQKKRTESRIDEYRAKRRDYYSKNRERLLASNAKSREKHKDKILAGKRRYYQENKSAANACIKEWAKKNPEKYSAYRRAVVGRRRAAVKSGDKPPVIAKWILDQPKSCKWCGAECANNYQIDHIIPVARGGTHTIDNLAISCPSCNHRKSAKTLDRWKQEMPRPDVVAA